MEPLTMSLIAGGSMLGGGILSNIFGKGNTAMANSAAKDLQMLAGHQNQLAAQKQMDFQERMSSSAYQRSMDDMRKAGLNPMLAFSQGGASSPGGAMGTNNAASVQTTPYSDPIGPAVASGLDAYQKGNTIRQADKALGQGDAGLALQASTMGISQANSTADIALKAAQAQATASSAKSTEVRTEILRQEAKKARLEGKWYDSDTGKTLYQMNKINEAAGGALDSMNSAKQLINPASLLQTLKGPKPKQKTKEVYIDKHTGEILP